MFIIPNHTDLFCVSSPAAIAAPRTCSEVRRQGGESGWYMLDPDQDGQDEFPVFCNMTSDSITAALHHDQEAGTKVEGYEDPESYVAKVFAWSTIYLNMYNKKCNLLSTIVMLNRVLYIHSSKPVNFIYK